LTLQKVIWLCCFSDAWPPMCYSFSTDEDTMGMQGRVGSGQSVQADATRQVVLRSSNAKMYE
jgi:hypothetical protein